MAFKINGVFKIAHINICCIGTVQGQNRDSQLSLFLGPEWGQNSSDANKVSDVSDSSNGCKGSDASNVSDASDPHDVSVASGN